MIKVFYLTIAYTNTWQIDNVDQLKLFYEQFQ